MRLNKLLKEEMLKKIKLGDEVVVIETDLGIVQIHKYGGEMGSGVEIYVNGFGLGVKLNDLERQTPTRGSLRLIRTKKGE